MDRLSVYIRSPSLTAFGAHVPFLFMVCFGSHPHRPTDATVVVVAGACACRLLL